MRAGWLLAALCSTVACDGSMGSGGDGGAGGTEGAESGDETGDASETGGGEGEGGSEGNGEGGSEGGTDPEDYWLADGWLQVLDSDTAVWIEAGSEVLPDGCNGDLMAAAGSGGLVFASAGGGSSDGGNDGGSGDPAPGGSNLVDDAQLRAWPGLSETPSPIYAASLSGTVSSTPGSEYPRGADLMDPNLDGFPIYLDVCETARQRGACFVPSDYPFAGCIGVEGEDLASSVIGNDAWVRSGDDWTLTTGGSYECEINELAPGHDESYPLGEQRITVAAGELPAGETVELTDAMVTWQSSYIATRECEYIEDLGDQCTCTWDLREDTPLDRGRLQLQGGEIHTDLMAGAFFLWGSFPTEG